jgi:hypothetical protein
MLRLFDVSNIDARGEVIMPGSVDWVMRNVSETSWRG